MVSLGESIDDGLFLPSAAPSDFSVLPEARHNSTELIFFLFVFTERIAKLNAKMHFCKCLYIAYLLRLHFFDNIEKQS